MRLTEAYKMARSLMREHGLEDLGWTYQFDNAVRRFGQTRYTSRTITMSRHLTQLNEPERVRNTILHEIAHALAGIGSGHGWKWKMIAEQIGCDAKRQYSLSNTVIPSRGWLAKCSCSQGQHLRVKRPAGKYVCSVTREPLTFRKVA